MVDAAARGAVYSFTIGFLLALAPAALGLAPAGAQSPARADWKEIPSSELQVIKGHPETVYDVAFSPAGDLLASASFDKTIKLWHAGDGSEAATLSGHGDKVLSVAFSPDGSTLLSGSADKTLKLWSLPASGPERIAAAGPVRGLAVSPDEKRLAAASAAGAIAAGGRGLGCRRGHHRGRPAVAVLQGGEGPAAEVGGHRLR